jgi:hypothetical protein
MNLYHGSTLNINKPIVQDIVRNLDFGNGFYTTTSYDQAARWAVVKKNRTKNAENAIVTIYKCSENLFENNKYNIKIFEEPNEDWLDFVIENRNGNKIHNFDIVKGPVANDNLFSTLTLFESGILTKIETISRLKTHKLFDQISFHNARVLLEIEYIGFKKIETLD